MKQILSLLLATTILPGCVVSTPGHLYPVQGPLSAQNRERAQLLQELHACLNEVYAMDSRLFVSPCSKKDTVVLTGISRADLFKALGEPTWGLEAPPTIESILSTHPTLWPAWSFYRLPKDTLGGGPELVCELDRTGQLCVKVIWQRTQ